MQRWAAVITIGVLVFFTGGCASFGRSTVEVSVLVHMDVCVQAACVTVPVSKADVTLTRQTEETLRKTANADGKAAFDVPPDVGKVTITAQSPLLSTELIATIDVDPQAGGFISVEMGDPTPARLNRRP